jgi:putative endonuclease
MFTEYHLFFVILCKITFTSLISKHIISKFAKNNRMAHHNTLGEAGEKAAATYLEKLGYRIHHRNWRKGHLELDIVATDRNELVVVEVKTRTDTAHIFPQEAVTPQKIRRTVIAADTYMKTFQIDAPVRFDIISIVGREDNFRIEHIKEAFYPPLF